ncbi:MAG TPA: AbrB/MazE/SpoVT family DNA-binding domain-containing protein [Blastocatellia bacterium]|nr:AbrB/MazE/SpoVT family DNA-binding domain-containing protein [Blastocatellia bacterium]
MSRRRITTAGDSAAILLPQEVLDQMGVKVGDEVDLSVVERTLILRPLDEAERARKIEEATDTVFERRKSAYEELAKGVE